MVADLDLPAADPGSRPADAAADARDGTTMTIHRVSVPRRCPRWSRIAPAGSSAARPGPVWPRLDPLAEVYAALVTGVRDYVGKNGFRSVILGPVRRDRLRADRHHRGRRHRPGQVHVVLMPSRYSSGHSVSDAEDLVKRQGLHARTVPIQPMVDAFQAELGLTGLAAENLQARVRGVILMGLSNAEGHLVLTTGNKSEMATGYSTLYGDSAGGFAPIKDVPKTLVWDLARWRNDEAARRGPDAADPGELDHQAAERRAAPPASSTPTRCPTTRCWTPCSTTTWSRTWARPSWSPPGTTPPWWTG